MMSQKRISIVHNTYHDEMRSKCVSKYFYIKIIAIQLHSVSTFYNILGYAFLKSDLGVYFSETISDTDFVVFLISLFTNHVTHCFIIFVT